ncbi:MAG: hypothetical protein U1A27_01745 [Phycisphaerae bacterium]
MDRKHATLPADSGRHEVSHAQVTRQAGELVIEPTAEILDTRTLATLLAEIEADELAAGVQRVTFDLNRVAQLGPQWTVVVAMLIGFARRIPAACRLDRLRGQPAAVLTLFAGRPMAMGTVATCVTLNAA